MVQPFVTPRACCAHLQMQAVSGLRQLKISFYTIVFDCFHNFVISPFMNCYRIFHYSRLQEDEEDTLIEQDTSCATG